MEVSYNVQTAVDSEMHLIRDYLVTNQATDHGLIAPTAEAIKREVGERILEIVSDKGYDKAENMVECLEQGMIPNVILPDGLDSYELEIEYEEKAVSLYGTEEEMKAQAGEGYNVRDPERDHPVEGDGFRQRLSGKESKVVGRGETG